MADPFPDRLEITHPDKVLFPEDGITKRELAGYYERSAPVMVPHMRARPVTMERYPAGIGAKGFMHKDVSRGFPPWLERVEVPKKGGTVHHPLVSDTRSDPEALRAAALAVRDLLAELDAHAVGRRLVQRDPRRLTQEFLKSDRGGRILVDTGRNGYSATFAAAYSVRARPGAPVSAPCAGEEVERGMVAPRTFTLRNMEERLAAAGDLWAEMPRRPRSLLGARARLEGGGG